MHVAAFAEKMEIDDGQYWRKAIGIFELELAFPIAGAHAIAPRPVRKLAFEQAGIMDAAEVTLMALLVDDRHPFRIGQEHAHERHTAFRVGPEIVEGIGVA